MTHIILSRVGFSISDPFEIVQAYAVPNDNKTHELRLSHETAPHIFRTTPWFHPVCFLLRNSVVDPVTGSTCLRLLHVSRSSHNQHFVCTDITLPANSSEELLPMSISTHVVFAIPDPDIMFIKLLSSTDGFARGLCTVPVASAKIHIRRFTIDATGEMCAGAVGDALPLPLVVDSDWSIEAFDGARGRICLMVDMDYKARRPVVLDIE